jgi:hypothetical protein
MNINYSICSIKKLILLVLNTIGIIEMNNFFEFAL